MSSEVSGVRNLVIVLGDQLDEHSTAFDAFDRARDVVWMAEVAEEAMLSWSSKQRTAVFLSAMRHFARLLRERGMKLEYTPLDAPSNTGSLREELAAAIRRLRPKRLILTAPGDWRVLQDVRSVAVATDVPLDLRDDTHFFSTVREFAAFARSRREIRLEYWYRAMRRKHGILMRDGEPAGGRWNFDADNRKSFGAAGPKDLPPRARFEPDALTREVIALVESRFADHPGRVRDFAWPLTREQAKVALHRFVAECLARFGTHEDAMWAGESWLFHSQLSMALNLKLLNPREVVAAAETAYREGAAPLAAVEGFIRQILGWREYVRGVYWTRMPGYLDMNALDAHAPLPAFYWTGDTDMACLQDVIRRTLDLGYAHHIERLMVTGLYALLLGVEPRQVHAWYLSVYVDAVEWVELPNTLGMSQFGDGGLMASKPYVASGRYIQRMSNHCRACRYDPGRSVGDDACPFTTLYWDFLIRHQTRLGRLPRMTMPLKHLSRLDFSDREAILQHAARHRNGLVE